MKPLHCIVLRVIASFVVATATSVAGGQPYPSRAITLVTPFPAGGVTDTLARVLAEHMRAPLGQPVVVENITGAGGTIGVARVVRAAPDGYTVGIGQWSSHVSAPALFPVTYDVLKDLAPVSLLPSSPLGIAVKKPLPANDISELIAWLKANPDKASAAVPGVGTAGHLCSVYLMRSAGVRFALVPYRGAGPAMQDLLAGHVDMMCGEASQMLPHLQSSRIRVLAVMAKSRWSGAPEIPTIDEAGLRGLYIAFWHGIWAPKGTPQGVIEGLNAAVVESLANPTMRERVKQLGQEIPAREQQTPQALASHHRSEVEKWWPIIKAENIEVN